MSDFQKALHSLLPDIMDSPRLFPHRLDMEKELALIIEVDQNFYKNAVFLDQRALNPNSRGAWVPLNVLWRHVDSKASINMARADFIFHIGHCGSTLISRLLDEIPTVLGLREPLLLRTMATNLSANKNHPNKTFTEIFKRSYRLLVRRFSPQQQVIIKPTSMCNNLAAQLLQQNTANRGILLYVKLEVYLANMLDKADNTDIDHFLAHRLVNLNNLVPELNLDIAALSRSEKVAFSWLSEFTQLLQLTKGDLGSRVLLMDFDQILTQTAVQLEMIFRHFSISAPQQALDKALASPVFRSYSKQPGFAYSARNRETILDESRQANHSAIRQGMAFVENLATNHPYFSEITDKIPFR